MMNRTALAAATGFVLGLALAVVGARVVGGREASTPAAVARVPEPDAPAEQFAWAEGVAAPPAELGRLRARVRTLGAELQAARSRARELEAAARATEAERRAHEQALARVAAPLDWLRDLAPGKFGDMTAEELLRLRELDLSDLELTDGDLAQLEHLPSLRALTLRRTDVGDTGLEHLGRLPLRDLGLRETQVTDAGIAHLGRHPTLVRLDLNTTAVGDAGLAHLAGNERLEFLRLNYTRVGDAGLAVLAGLPALQRVDLWGLEITDEGLSALWDHPSLRHLEIGAVDVSKAWVDGFRAAHPDCYVRSRWGR